MTVLRRILTTAPAAGLVAGIVIASLATTALFWLVLGGVSGALYRRFA